MKIDTIGVVGAGVMGSSLTEALTLSGFKVILIDTSPEKLEKFESEFVNKIRMHIIFHGKNKDLDPEKLLKNVRTSDSYDLLSDTKFIVENVTEDFSIKEKMYAKLDEVCGPDTIYASNTSAIPITKQASFTKHPENVIGIHFMNPVPFKSTVELIPGYHTSKDTIEKTKEVLKGMGKDWVLVKDSPGFVSNRVLMLTINEAIFLLYENVSSTEDVDNIFKKCFGHKMGPLETADLIGLDTILKSIEVLYESFNDSKYRPCPLLKKMVDAGLYGRKSGKGFYEYN